MKSVLQTLKRQIEDELRDQSTKSLSMDGLSLTEKLACTWMALDDVYVRLGTYKPPCDCDCEMPPAGLTEAEAKAWNDAMKNVDGTTGGHWTIDQTDALAKQVCVEFTHISHWCWNVTCNMMYSDYFDVANCYGVNEAKFYGRMAKAFLFDPDAKGGPAGKLNAYYHAIVK